MSKGYRDQAKGVFFKFVGIGSADTAPFYFYENIPIPYFRDWKFLYFILFQCGKHGYPRRRRRLPTGRCTVSCRNIPVHHAFKDLFYYRFHINCVYVAHTCLLLI